MYGILTRELALVSPTPKKFGRRLVSSMLTRWLVVSVSSTLTSPKNWASNTFVVATGIGLAAYGLWNLSSEREVRGSTNKWRHNPPIHPIPSQRVSVFF